LIRSIASYKLNRIVEFEDGWKEVKDSKGVKVLDLISFAAHKRYL
jgi:hypothetical protein